MLKLLEIKAMENLRVLREPVDRKAWGDTAPSVVNAFYEPSRNQISTLIDRPVQILASAIHCSVSCWYSAEAILR